MLQFAVAARACLSDCVKLVKLNWIHPTVCSTDSSFILLE